ncbi:MULTISPECIES: hypothetical protein [unclassified Tolypothrix]|uniref:hypothetical protein n=1 Tax=unclassified Tolypothrix TaxID=2649714 RepID=UPI0005F78A14|nr:MULTISPECIES: hypothetical protein [unclassified Tolypothrix]MBE9085009.1 hypothetical protein [Tolypothrix sp. LEGE 11397]UYD24309.1 hypothetical protein HGR01_22895 [Tolypothrix sp. PCC 7712]UYD33459.1 hypothetical protein HG267_31790 [Tolypothrix sp. PCC 7601]BAY90090.1 hypothetical protein NIES3275_21000 [Microchaete diplosiphon NIES-3275]
MKVKLLNVLTVCVVFLAVLSPALLVFSMVWGKHLELVKAQNLTCEVNNNMRADSFLVTQSGGVSSSQSQPSINLSKQNLQSHNLTVVEQYQLATIMQWFFLLTPICVGLGIIAYDRYLVYRNAVFQEQVEMLERLWQQSIEQ